MTIATPRMLPLYQHLQAEIALQVAFAVRGVLQLETSRALYVARERAAWVILIRGEA